MNELVFLDEACYDDYLEKLVPKAVAYSAGLLEFLFRGDIDFEVDVSDTVPIACMQIERLGAEKPLGCPGT